MPQRPVIRHGLERAFYDPAADFVGMPAPQRFDRDADYYSVLFHELTHATGHESRLSRKGVNGSDGLWSAFGSQPYCREELVAEMGAAFLCGQAGIVERTIDNSAAYVASWLSRLKDDVRLVVQAAAQASHALISAAIAIASSRAIFNLPSLPVREALNAIAASYVKSCKFVRLGQTLRNSHALKNSSARERCKRARLEWLECVDFGAQTPSVSKISGSAALGGDSAEAALVTLWLLSALHLRKVGKRRKANRRAR